MSFLHKHPNRVVAFKGKGDLLRTHRSWHNPSLGLMIKVRAYKVAGQEGSLGITSYVPKSAKSVREWTLTLPSELPFWELESQWIPKSSEGDYKGQNPSV